MRSRVLSMLLLAIATSVTGAPAAPRCSGNACAALRMDAAKCKLKNVGNATIKAELKNGSTLMITLKAGVETEAMKPFGGCFKPKQMADGYTVNYVGEAPKNADARTGTEIAAEMGFVDPHSCTGNACDRVTYEVDAGCVWLKNASSTSVAAEVKVGGKTVALELKAEKTEAQTKISSAHDDEPPRRCLNAWRLQDTLENMRKQGVDVQGYPDLTRKLNECGAKPTEESKKKADDEAGNMSRNTTPS